MSDWKKGITFKQWARTPVVKPPQSLDAFIKWIARSFEPPKEG